MNLIDVNNLCDSEEIISLLKSEEVIDIFKSQKINSIIAFGSIVTDQFEDYSDIDIAILSKNKISLSNIMNLEEVLGGILNREIDIIDLSKEDLDLRFKVSIYDTGVLIYNDELDLYNKGYCETERVYKDNQDFRYFRERDVLFDE